VASANTTVTAQFLNAIRSRKFNQIGKLCASDIDFQAWTPVGHWIATDPSTVAKIIEVWFTPGAGASVIAESRETSAAKGFTILELEIGWTLVPEDQPRILREVYLLTIKQDKASKADKITEARVYCAGLHTEFPEVDLEKQRRAKGLAGPKMSNSPRVVTPTAKAS
jgi:hypothetical protein